MSLPGNYDSWRLSGPSTRNSDIADELDEKCRYYKKNFLHRPSCRTCGIEWAYDSIGKLAQVCNCEGQLECMSCSKPLDSFGDLDIDTYLEYEVSDGSDIY